MSLITNLLTKPNPLSFSILTASVNDMIADGYSFLLDSVVDETKAPLKNRAFISF